MYYAVCGMVYIKEPLLLIGKSSPCDGSSRFILSMTEWSFTYNGLWYTSCGALAGTAMSKSGLMVACLNHTWIPTDIVNREIEWSGDDLLKKIFKQIKIQLTKFCLNLGG